MKRIAQIQNRTSQLEGLSLGVLLDLPFPPLPWSRPAHLPHTLSACAKQVRWRSSSSSPTSSPSPTSPSRSPSSSRHRQMTLMQQLEIWAILCNPIQVDFWAGGNCNIFHKRPVISSYFKFSKAKYPKYNATMPILQAQSSASCFCARLKSALTFVQSHWIYAQIGGGGEGGYGASLLHC